MKIDYKEVAERRRVVDWFSNVKLSKLFENTHKGTWKDLSIEELLVMAGEEFEELQEAIEFGNHNDIIRECGDVSNIVMFIADKFNK